MKARLLSIAVAVLVFVPTALSATHAGGHVKKASAGTTIVVYASGDVNVQNLWQNNIIPGFEKANKGIYVKFIFSEHGTDDGTTLARIGAAVKGRHWPGIDLVDGGLVTTLAAAGLNQPVLKATAPNLKKVNQDLLVPVKGAAIPYRGSSVVLAYNSDKVEVAAEDAAGAARLDPRQPRQVHLQLAEHGRLGLLLRGDGRRQPAAAGDPQADGQGLRHDDPVELEAGSRPAAQPQ